MAERRMFAKTIIDSDAFLDMPLSAQALYFHLSMRADDEGFVNNPKKIQRMVGASDDDCKLLVLKRFILAFESGVIAIKHWKIHNYIRNDRFKETVYVKEKSMLALNENNAYTEVDTVGIPNDNHLVYQMDTQVSIGKDSIGKDKRKKERNIYINKSNVCSLSHEDIMNSYNLSDVVKDALKEFLKSCYLNHHIVSNEKLDDIVFRLIDDCVTDNERIECVNRAISGGYFDIKT